MPSTMVFDGFLARNAAGLAGFWKLFVWSQCGKVLDISCGKCKILYTFAQQAGSPRNLIHRTGAFFAHIMCTVFHVKFIIFNLFGWVLHSFNRPNNNYYL